MIKKSNSSTNKLESVWDYPRPPAVEDVPQRIKVVFNGETIADSQDARRVLETSHPPVYYIPLKDIKPEVLRHSHGSTSCEWKGQAAYYDVVVGGKTALRAAWYYPEPDPKYASIKDCVAFYPSKMEACFVGEERVKSQEGDFYGGWINSNITGPFKGGPGTRGW